MPTVKRLGGSQLTTGAPSQATVSGAMAAAAPAPASAMPDNVAPWLRGAAKPAGASDAWWAKEIAQKQAEWTALAPDARWIAEHDKNNPDYTPAIGAQGLADDWTRVPADQRAGYADADKQAQLASAAPKVADAITSGNEQYFDQTVGATPDAVKQALALSGTTNNTALDAYNKATAPLGSAIAPSGYQGDAVANGADRAIQQGLISKYQGMTNPAVTGVERANANAARLKFESDDQASRQAQMRDLALRGLHSGGAQIAQQQATHDTLSNNRLSAELGLQATAQTRSENAMAGLQAASQSLRSDDDALSVFNAAQKQTAAQAGDTLKENDATRRGTQATADDAAARDTGTTNVNNAVTATTGLANVGLGRGNMRLAGLTGATMPALSFIGGNAQDEAAKAKAAGYNA